MKDFIKKTIQGMWSTAGYDQAKELKERGGLTAVTQMIDVLVIECKRFPKIPDSKKQELIESGIRTEVAAGYFRGLNAALINKWFYAYGISKQGQSVQAGDPPGFWEAMRKNELYWKEVVLKNKEADSNWCIENEIQDYKTRIEVMKTRGMKRKIHKQYYANGTEDVQYTET